MLRKIRKRITIYLLWIFYGITYLAPYRVNLFAGAVLGKLAYYILGKYRNIAYKNINTVLSKNDAGTNDGIIREMFINYGKILFEFLQLPKLNKNNIGRYVEIVNEKHFSSAFKKGKGVILLTAHIGNFEMLGAVVSILGYPLNIMSRQTYLAELHEMLVKLRTSVGSKLIVRGEPDSARQILRALKKNESIGILIDQNIKSIPGIYANFLGRPAYTPLGLAAIAMKSGCSVVPGFIVRKKDNTHLLEFLPEVDIIKTGDHESDIKTNTERFNKIIGMFIQKYPEQWVWIHKRWDDI